MPVLSGFKPIMITFPEMCNIETTGRGHIGVGTEIQQRQQRQHNNARGNSSTRLRQQRPLRNLSRRAGVSPPPFPAVLARVP